ncbi:hypothetical protein L5515_019492 [Caenorhabditis briggsae]|uniref:Uncharacterized protein n=1 Tax=Caenorhabditis briggsae TaxID=6238 RepID=A0AAE9FJY5_CAEBR|nr:hypothetical protein L5515_019492 [Caenorhabditis briggsae]
MFCPMPFVPQHIVKTVYPPSNSSANMNKLQLNLTDTSTMNHYLAGIAIKYSLDEDDNEIQVLKHIEKKSTDGPEHYSSIFNQPGNGDDDTQQYQRPGPKMKKCGSKQANIKKCKMCRVTKCTCREVHNRTLNNQAHHGSLGTQQVRIPGLLGSIYLPSPGVIERAMDPIYRQSSSISLSHVPSLLELGLPGAQDIRVSYQVSNPVGVSSGSIGILPNDKMEQTMDRRSLQDNIVQKKPFSNPEKHQPATDQIPQSQSGPVSTENSALKNCYETEKKLITVRPAGMSYENYREALFDQFDEMRLAKKKICLRFLNEPIYGAGISVPQKPKILFGSAMKTETVPLFEPSNLPSHLLPVAKSAEYVSSSAQQRLKHCEEAMYGQWDKTKTESDCSCESKKKLLSTGQQQCRVASTP